jgi:hypothetical protein
LATFIREGVTMFKTSRGDEIFIIDGHMHLWDASPDNQANKYGAGFIGCFYDYHRYGRQLVLCAVPDVANGSRDTRHGGIYELVRIASARDGVTACAESEDRRSS